MLRRARHYRTALICLSLTAAGFASVPAFAQNIFQERDAAEEEALRAAEAASAEQIRAARLEAELETLSSQLAELGLQIVDREHLLLEARERLASLRIEVDNARARLRQTLSKLEKLTGAIQRAAREPTPSLLVHPDRPVEAARSALLMRRLTDDLNRATLSAREDLARIAEATQAARAVEEQAQQDLSALQRDESKVRDLLARKREALTNASEAVAAAARSAQEAQSIAENLSELASALDAIKPPSIRPRPKGKREGSFKLPERPKPKREKQRLAFSRARGEVPFPVAGTMTKPDKRAYVAELPPGVFFMTRPYARVIAPWDGVVRFADDFPNYGKIVIIEPQPGYQILLTGLASVDRRVGEEVLQGEPLGRMGGPRPTSVEFLFEVSEETSAAREALYVEIRKEGNPVAPAAWFSRRSQKVSGL
ncbi:MAG: peptidoglycan DD-metalloendopeptidase family protein [Neomegalonema sp.]|nr:peptidoglycan DD-metalloendopeptidase family protein [Neomegalonema sp.]